MKNEEIIRQWYEEVWNNKNEAYIDKLLAKDCIAHGLADEDGREIVGPDSFKMMFRKFIASFPNIHFQVIDTVNEGNKIVALVVGKFMHTGNPFLAFPEKAIQPTGKEIVLTGTTLTIIEDGQIKEAWNNFDFLSFYAQLGAI